jgi:hypothetical protein
MDKGLGTVRQRAQRLIASWHRLLLGFALFVMTVPLVPLYPVARLDPAWKAGMSRALAENLTIGKDLVFTYGPFAGVATDAYDPDVRWLPLLGGLVLFIGYLATALALVRTRSRWVAVIASVVVLLGLVTTDATLLLLPVLVLASLLPRRSGLPLPTVSPRSVLAQSVALGLLPLIKVSAAPGAVLCVLLGAVVLARRHAWGPALLLLVTPPVTAVVLWAVAGQPLGGLVDFVRASVPITSGYSEAMYAAALSPALALPVVVTSLVLVAVLAAGREHDPDRWLLGLMAAATLFLTFKAEFVRIDSHTLTAVTVLPLVAALVVDRTRKSVTRRVVLSLAIVVAAVVSMAVPAAGRIAIPTALHTNLVTAPSLAVERIVRPHLLDQHYDAALGRIADACPLPALRGNADVYSSSQYELFSHHVQWNPRPVFQSYSAYTAGLQRANARHLEGRSAPDSIVFRVDPIDHRMPALEDGASWLDLLTRYRLDPRSTDQGPHPGNTTNCTTDQGSIDDGFLLLTRRARPLVAPTGPPLEIDGRLDQRVYVPATVSGWLASFDVRPTTLGKVRNLLWAAPPLRIEVMTNNGMHRSRFVAAMAHQEFLLSPYIVSTRDLGRLFDRAPGTGLTGTVTSIRISVQGGSGYWHDAYRIRLRPVQLPTS